MTRKSSTYVQEFTVPSGTEGAKPGGGPLPPLPRQRRRRMFVLGLLLVVAGALIAGYLFTGVGNRTAVVVVTRDVPFGTQLSAGDISTTRASVDANVAVIPGQQMHQVIGRYAAVDLRRGTLLAPSQLTAALSPRPGQQVVPVAVKLGQLPARGFRPGDQVLVIATPGQQGQEQDTGNGAAPLGQDTPATVDAVSNPDADGNVRIDLVVDAKVGPAIAKQASTGRLGFVLTSRGPQ